MNIEKIIAERWSQKSGLRLTIASGTLRRTLEVPRNDKNDVWLWSTRPKKNGQYSLMGRGDAKGNKHDVQYEGRKKLNIPMPVYLEKFEVLNG